MFALCVNSKLLKRVVYNRGFKSTNFSKLLHFLKDILLLLPKRKNGFFLNFRYGFPIVLETTKFETENTIGIYC